MTQEKKFHVVHLTTDSAIGGTERMIAATAGGLPSNRFRSTVVTLLNRGELEHLCRQKGILYQSVAMRSKTDLFAVFRLYKLLKKLQPDILHTYLFHANIIGRVVGRLMGIPVVISGQRNVDIWRKWYHNIIDRMTSRFCDVIISNSFAGKIFLQEKVGIPADKIEVVHNGIILPEIPKSAPSDTFTIVNIASLTKKKGQEYLITAFSRLRQHGISAKLVIVGAGKRHSYLEECAFSAGVKDSVLFAGFQKNVVPYLIEADVFVLPSLWEGIPVALMEAMSYAKPCVATRVGGVPELITHGKDGLLVNPENSVELFDALLHLFKNKTLREQIGYTARKRIESEFSLNAMVDSIAEIYNRFTKDF
ncbi:MAG: glycosyltransferase [Candidatus Auribacterota bacterium]|jgi:glycosyltransferase involved in cell wall biosynthesis|nr:glycosyltransferase [Candidatus Auribacterota bacterium]